MDEIIIIIVSLYYFSTGAEIGLRKSVCKHKLILQQEPQLNLISTVKMYLTVSEPPGVSTSCCH